MGILALLFTSFPPTVTYLSSGAIIRFSFSGGFNKIGVLLSFMIYSSSLYRPFDRSRLFFFFSFPVNLLYRLIDLFFFFFFLLQLYRLLTVDRSYLDRVSSSVLINSLRLLLLILLLSLVRTLLLFHSIDIFFLYCFSILNSE